MAGEVDSIMGIVPVAVAGGVVMGFTDKMMKMMDQGPIEKVQLKAQRREKRRVGKAGKVVGDFRNVGF